MANAGHPNKTIAYDFGIACGPSRFNVVTKMEAASLSQLIRIALTGRFVGKTA